MATALQGLWQVFLDGRKLRTPARHTLAVPSRALALAIAAEWKWQVRWSACVFLYSLSKILDRWQAVYWLQEPGKVRPVTMPLMSVAATAIDQARQLLWFPVCAWPLLQRWPPLIDTC